MVVVVAGAMCCHGCSMWPVRHCRVNVVCNMIISSLRREKLRKWDKPKTPV